MLHPLYQLPTVEPESRRTTFSEQRYNLQGIPRPALARPRTRCPETWTSAAKAENPDIFRLPPFQCAERLPECTQCSSLGRTSFIRRCIACLRSKIKIFRFWCCGGSMEKNPPSTRSSINTDDIIDLSYISCSQQCSEIKVKPRL